MADLERLVAMRVACPWWPDCDDDEGPCQACAEAAAIIARLKRAEELERELRDLRERDRQRDQLLDDVLNKREESRWETEARNYAANADYWRQRAERVEAAADQFAYDMDFAAELSKLLFQARESIESWADVVERQTGRQARHEPGLVERIDAFRVRQGWSPDGFGGEEGGGG